MLNLMNGGPPVTWSYAESNLGYFVNYTHAYELYGDDLNVSPRNTFNNLYVFKDNEEIARDGKKLFFMDTEREKELNIG